MLLVGRKIILIDLIETTVKFYSLGLWYYFDGYFILSGLIYILCQTVSDF